MNTEPRPPRISVIVPSYNQARYLENALLSVLRQGYPDVELIVMDGGSTDGSVEIIRRYEGSVAHWRSRADEGQAAAIAEGLDRSTGDILCYLNSDDLFLPGAFQRVAEVMRRAGDMPCWAVGGNVRIDASGAIRRRDLPINVTQRSMLVWGSGFAQPSAFWNRRMLDISGGIDPSLHFCLDYELFLRFAGVSDPVIVRAYLSAFRDHSESKSATLADVHRQELAEVRSRYLSVRSAYPAYLRAQWIAYWCQWKAMRLRTLVSPVPALPGGWPRG